MKSHCFKYFGLVISFVGWFLMGLLTCGLGFIWVMPYLNTAKIVFYKRELQGDKTVYRNPMETEIAAPDFSANVGQSDEIAFTVELPSMPEPDVPPENLSERQSVSAEANAEAKPLYAVREAPAFEKAAQELGRMNTVPLPGGRVFLDGAGRRVVDRRRAQPEAEQDDKSIEISESGEERVGESLREQIARRRAERASVARGDDTPRRRSSDRRRPDETVKETEIGDDQ